MFKTNPQIQKKIKDFAQKHHLSLVLVFGSQSTGHANKESDIDVAFIPKDTTSTEEEIQINYELTEIFKTDRIDTVNIHHATPLLMKRIFDEATILYQKRGDEFSRYEIYALRRYREARPLFDLHKRELESFIHATQ